MSHARTRLSRSLPAPARPHSPPSSRHADPNPPRATRPPPLISNRPPAAPEGVFFFVLCRERAGDPTAGENAVVIEALQAYRHRISASSADSSADSNRPEPRARATPNHPTRREDGEDGEDGEDTDEAFVVFDHLEVSAAARRAARTRAALRDIASVNPNGWRTSDAAHQIRAVAAAEPRLSVAVVSCDELDGMANVITRPRVGPFSGRCLLVSPRTSGNSGEKTATGNEGNIFGVVRDGSSVWMWRRDVSRCFEVKDEEIEREEPESGNESDSERDAEQMNEKCREAPVAAWERAVPGDGTKAKRAEKATQPQQQEPTPRKVGPRLVAAAEELTFAKYTLRAVPTEDDTEDGKAARGKNVEGGPARGVAVLCFLRNGVEISGRLDGLVDSLQCRAKFQRHSRSQARKWNAGEKRRVAFHYLYHNSRMHKTEVMDGFTCPFCLSVSFDFACLTRHLESWHQKFNFIYDLEGVKELKNTVRVQCREEDEQTLDEDEEWEWFHKHGGWYVGCNQPRRVPAALVDRVKTEVEELPAIPAKKAEPEKTRTEANAEARAGAGAKGGGLSKMHDAPREDPADVSNANEAPGSEEAGNEEYVPHKQMLKKYTNKEFVFASRRYPLPTLTYQKMAQAHKEEMRLLRQERKHEQKLMEKQRQRLKRQQAQFNRRQRERREREEHFEETMRQKTEEAEMHRLFARQVTHDSLAREGMSGMFGGVSMQALELQALAAYSGLPGIGFPAPGSGFGVANPGGLSDLMNPYAGGVGYQGNVNHAGLVGALRGGFGALGSRPGQPVSAAEIREFQAEQHRRRLLVEPQIALLENEQQMRRNALFGENDRPAHARLHQALEAARDTLAAAAATANAATVAVSPSSPAGGELVTREQQLQPNPQPQTQHVGSGSDLAGVGHQNLPGYGAAAAREGFQPPTQREQLGVTRGEISGMPPNEAPPENEEDDDDVPIIELTKPRKRRKRIGLDDGRDSTPRGDLNSGDGAGPSSGLGPGLGRRLGAGGSGDGDDITIADLAAVADLAANASPSPLVKARPAKAPRREMAAVNRSDALAHMSVDSIIATVNRNLASKSQAKEEAVEPKPERVRKKPGPKPGSKNRKRLAAEAAAAAAAGEAGTSQGARGNLAAKETGGIGLPGTFYHARTYVPVAPPAPGRDPMPDSDDDEDLQGWAREDLRRLSDFEDVVHAEKAFMHDWNVFVRRYKLYADRELPATYEAYAHYRGAKMVEDPMLRRLFTLHLVNAFDFAAVPPEVVDRTLRVVDSYKPGGENHSRTYVMKDAKVKGAVASETVAMNARKA